MINIKLGNIKISFEFGFFAVVTFFCLLDAPEIAFSAVCACIAHESGHILASVLCDVKIEKIIFRAGGIKMNTEVKLISISKNIFILMLGPAINLFMAIFYYTSQCYSPFSVNLILGLFNLLPFSNLDGGAAIKNILDYFNIESDRLMKIIAVISAVVTAALLCFMGVGSFTGYITLIFLVICEFIY